MDELYNSNPEQGLEAIDPPEPAYNKHYVVTDAQGRIIDGWSDGPHPERDAAGAICINEQGGYQFRLPVYFVDEEGRTRPVWTGENPALYTMDGIPLYRWDGERVMARTDEEIATDRIPPLETVQAAKLAELSAACNGVIVSGCNVTLMDGSSGHISLTAEDQINLTNACAAVEGGAEAYPYHLDGGLCALYPAADIRAMAQAATAHKLYHTTYYNHLAAWVRRCEASEDVQGITYGAELPDDLAAHMAGVLAAAGGEDDV